MRDSGLDAIVATTAANVTYLSGYRNRLEVETRRFMLDPGAGTGLAFASFAIATLGGRRVALVVHSLFAAGALGLGATVYPYGRAGLDFANGRRSGGSLIRVLEEAEWETEIEALAAVLRAGGLADGRIGLELPTEARNKLARALPKATIRDCAELFRTLRAVKTPTEIERLRAAARAAERALDATLAGAGSDVTLDELSAGFRVELAADGAELEHLACSPQGAGIAMHSGASLREEVAYLDYGCIRDLVRSDSGLTVAFRQPEPDLVTRFRALEDAVAVGAEHLRPGASASRIWKSMRAHIDRTGVVSSPQGHGLGLEAREYPLIGGHRGNDHELEARMVVNLEAATFLPGVASMHIERSFVIGARGAEPLLAEPLDRLLVLEPRLRPHTKGKVS